MVCRLKFEPGLSKIRFGYWDFYASESDRDSFLNARIVGDCEPLTRVALLLTQWPGADVEQALMQHIWLCDHDLLEQLYRQLPKAEKIAVLLAGFKAEAKAAKVAQSVPLLDLATTADAVSFLLLAGLVREAAELAATPGIRPFCSPAAAAFVQSVLTHDAAQRALDELLPHIVPQTCN